MAGLLVELDPGEKPKDLPKPPSLAGARLRRKVPLDSLTKALKSDLARLTRVLEKRIERELRRTGILADIERDAQKREKAGPIGRGGIPLGPERDRALSRTFQFDGMEAVVNLFEDEEDVFRIELESVLGSSYTESFNKGGKAARLELGASGSFKLKNTAIADALQARANHLAGDIAEDVFDRLKTVIADGFYLEGRGIPDVARALRDEFDWLSKVRSERIARTETLSVTEEGQHTVYKASGVPFKRWLATLDGRERPEHFEAHGQIRAIDEPFDVGGDELMFPGDPDGSPGMICNCRCSQQPIVTADQVFSEADVWRGDNDPDEFARDREEPRDELTQGPSPPPASDTEDLQFADEEQPPEDTGDGEEKRTSPEWSTALEVDVNRVAPDIVRWWKAEREYERDEAGRFGSGSGPPKKPEEAGGGGTATAAPAMREHSPAVEEQLRDSEDAIKSQNYETAVVIDDEGLVALNKDGGANSVEFTTQEQAGMYDRVVTHNHPGTGGSFSGADIELASNARVREMRAVAPDGTVYRMQSERGSTWPNAERIKAATDAAIAPVAKEISQAVKRGDLTPTEGSRENNHRIWERVAPQVGLIYERDESRRQESSQIRGEREFFAGLRARSAATAAAARSRRAGR